MIGELIAIGLTCYNLSEKKNNDKNAKRVRESAFQEISIADYKISNYSKMVDTTLVRLSSRRQSVFEQTFPLFINTMKPLDMIEVTPGNSQIILHDMEHGISQYENLVKQYTIEKTEITKFEAISSYFLFGIAGYYRKKSELTLEQSKIMKKSATMVSAHSKNILDFLMYINQECVRMEELTVKFNILLIKSIKCVQTIIEKNGENKYLYSSDERETIMVCFNIADALRKIINCNPFENDAISNMFVRVIEAGNQQLKELQLIVDGQVNNVRR